ncbi:MAG: oligosaccharide flippase family protein, partial [Clostridia bacterium]|nr:oligosaccharide flippase family protein [Clostridia bacterium]
MLSLYIFRGDIIKKGLAKTVVFVTALSVLERFIGFIYRIYLSRSIGSEGLGIYQIALTLFGLLLTVTSSGIPITVSRMMTKYFASKDEKSAFATVTAGIIFSLSLSVPIVVFFFVFRSKLGFIFTDERCMDVLMIVLPGLIITSVYAVIRGFFWGKKSFLTYSLIELAEEAVMLVAGVVLIGAVTSKMSGVEKAAWAVLISYAFSFAAASAVFFIKGGRLVSPKNTLKPLAKSSAPITGMRTATSLINSLIAIILPLRLISAGLTRTEAMAEFGAAFGMAIPILFMPATLIGSLAVVLVPELSENYYKNQKENLINNVERALKFSFFVACIIIPVLVSFGKNLGIFFYSSGEAGKYLTYAAPVMLPMSICMITTSMLNSLNC